ncbi:protein FAM229A [Amazona ochrocephala]
MGTIVMQSGAGQSRWRMLSEVGAGRDLLAVSPGVGGVMLRGCLGSHRSLLSPRHTHCPAMSSQSAPQARRFPIEAGDCPSSEVPPEVQESPGTEWSVGSSAAVCFGCAVPGCAVRCLRAHFALSRRQLRRCPGSHCLTLPNVPIDVFIATGGSGRPRTS